MIRKGFIAKDFFKNVKGTSGKVPKE